MRKVLALVMLFVCCAAVTARSGVEQIRALRLENNRATLERNVAALREPWKSNVRLIESDGSYWTNAEDLARSYATTEFKDPYFVEYVRIPTSITISADGFHAAETGNWTAINKPQKRVRSGVYLASWEKVSGSWKIVYEAYVALNLGKTPEKM